ncbi:hypothetical protein W97_09322 [Coniosporium apollinis CBS 100218]|uniref:Uncharacterized protein n=1 Tax=Coniosporium apollinis (strain CBS 100218) TaxID=1168221 RepID=R7Z7Q2_CONA1|nr:uncharacterized protein W97_09322 [Coniosporium apollinis CBS 100218]EON70054.1 hypothetical protein W97_09322 [Coniosporium apollinis CBS 100218]
MFFPFFVSLLLSVKCDAIPLLAARKPDNLTAEADPSWVSSPNVRGTFDLLLASLTTLSLCAWTAYHPNVQSTNSLVRNFFHRLWWMLVVIFAPEVVLFNAWEQWWTARRLQREVCQPDQPASTDTNVAAGSQHPVSDTHTQDQVECFVCAGTDPSPEEDPEHNRTSIQQPAEAPFSLNDSARRSTNSSPRRDSTRASLDNALVNSTASGNVPPVPTKSNSYNNHSPWTIEQAFFAVSGGFAIDSSSFGTQPQLTFTPLGITTLAKQGLLPKTSGAMVSDKSKADVIAKVLICIQAGWFLIQSLARVARNLPLTLLELHVLTHVACAFCMYLFWINKPYDVGCPIICEDDAVVDMVALFALQTRAAESKGEWKCAQRHSFELSEIEGAHIHTERPPRNTRYARKAAKFIIDPMDRPNIKISWIVNLLEMPEIPTHLSILPDRNNEDTCTPAVREQWLRANRALESIRSTGGHFRWYSVKKPYYVGNSEEKHYQRAVGVKFEDGKTFVVPSRSNLRIEGAKYAFGPKDVRDRLYSLQTKTFTVLTALYGGAHLFAWRAHFPSTAEMWMWRSSGIVMAGAPLTWALFIILGDVSNWMDPPGLYTRKLTSFELCRYAVSLVVGFVAALWGVLGCCLMGLYPVARVYVLVEAFVSLRSPPLGTYTTVQWTDFIPHVG